MRRIPLLVALVLVLAGLGIARAPEASAAVDTTRFIRGVAPAAQRAHETYRVPASVSIAQSILESGWGTSSLSLYGHAYFGIKCKTAYSSPFQLGCMDKASLEYFDPADPVPIVSAFRTYRSADDSFADHGYFLKNSPRYAAAFTTNNPDDYIREVGRAGYATDPKYADHIIGLMQKYSLYQYDTSPIVNTPVPVDGAIGDRYRAVGGATSALSYPIGGEQDGPVVDAKMVPFNRGLLVWSPANGAHPLTGAIWNHYRFSQSVRDHLQLPITDAYAVGSATMQKFTGGAIVRSGGTDRVVWGEIARKWFAMSAERGPLGLPTSGEMCGLVRGGCWQTFTGGRLYWSPATGAQPLWGLIGQRWNEMGYEHAAMGYPTTPEHCGLRDGGCWQGFEGGMIHWSPASGAWPSWGAIQGHWAANGWERGRYGYPLAKETCRMDGSVFMCTQRYQGGTITFRSDRGAY